VPRTPPNTSRKSRSRKIDERARGCSDTCAASGAALGLPSKSLNRPIEILLTGTGHDLVQLGRSLQEFGCFVQVHARLETAIRVWARGNCAAAVVSIPAGGPERFSTIAALREQCPDATIVTLSASGQPEDRKAAIDAGADDYLTDPCSAAEIHARVTPIVQHRTTAARAELHLGPLSLKAGELSAFIGKTRIELSPNERALLELFALAPDHGVGRNVISLRFGKNGSGISMAAVHLLVYRLRRRLLPFGFSVSTLRGVGYRLRLPGVDRQRTGNGTEPDVPLAEEPLERDLNSWNTRLLEYVNDAIIIWEMQGRGILFWNQAAEKLYGYGRDAAIGRTTHQLLDTQLAGGVTHLESSLARYGAWIGELTHTTASGKRVRVEARLALMSQSNGRWLVLEVNRDVTDVAALEKSRSFMDSLLSDLHALPDSE
jgi:two-component system OmpR family response regulator